MRRINIIVEGQTEESFIKNVLSPYLWPQAIYLTPIILGVPGHKGGNVTYDRVKKDLLLLLKQDRVAGCSTMFDLYGLGRGFPGTPTPNHWTGLQRAMYIEQGMYDDIVSATAELQSRHRFIAYLQVHEYEGLLFSDPEAFAMALGRSDLSQSMADVRSAFPTPEDINDDPERAPSKRVRALHPSYKKVIEGTSAAQRVGLENMLRECPHFRNWVDKLAASAA